MEFAHIFMISALCAMALWLSFTIFRLVHSIIAARSAINEMMRSDEHPGKIRMFVAAQAKLSKMEIWVCGINLIILVFDIAVLKYLLATWGYL